MESAVFAMRDAHKERCRGYGFRISMDDETVVVPQAWDIPTGAEAEGYKITGCQLKEVRASSPMDWDRRVVAGIIREGCKKHFKTEGSRAWGPLWQDFRGFCQMPGRAIGDQYLFARKVEVQPEYLRGGLLALQVRINTVTIDGRTLADHYAAGDARIVAKYIRLKRANRTKRDNRPADIRVLHDQTTAYQDSARARELADPEALLSQVNETREQQRILSNGNIQCTNFPRGTLDVPMKEVRLILDTQITQDRHRESILEPPERADLLLELRGDLDGVDIFGTALRLADLPLNATPYAGAPVPPPAQWVRGAGGTKELLESPNPVGFKELRNRARDRANRVRKYGFMVTRPITPLLACPSEFGKKRAQRLLEDFNALLRDRAIDNRFELVVYETIGKLARDVRDGGFDALLAVLPERPNEPYGHNDTHEQIKREIQVPSQCIFSGNTLPARWVDLPARKYHRQDPAQSRRISNRYAICLESLLVKAHWLPFLPAEPFHFNLHVALDVGGKHNQQAVVALIYGLSLPGEEPVVLCEEISVDAGKAEPIPKDALYGGLLRIFESLRTNLCGDAGGIAHLDRVLFFRDGRLLGDGPIWNERDTLHRLHRKLLERGWITQDSVWVAAEVHKTAGGWRMLCDQDGRVRNPLVGLPLYPFDSEHEAILSTTGDPFLRQGTASPNLISLVPIHGETVLEEVLRDFVWGADLAFTKPDMGMGLPWAMHVADAGALQMARGHQISGVPA